MVVGGRCGRKIGVHVLALLVLGTGYGYGMVGK